MDWAGTLIRSLVIRRIHHDGQYPGFRGDYERFEDDKLTIILLANSGTARLERLALKIASFYSKELVSPTFQASERPIDQPIQVAKPAFISVTVKNGPRSAPESVIELEVWDQSLKAIYKQSKTNENFDAGESKTYEFTWTPSQAGEYTVNLGVYGPKWVTSYFWHQGMAKVRVR